MQRVRWVGGYGAMDSAEAVAYTLARADPVANHAASAIAHLNRDHADGLLLIAQALGGYPDATTARCVGLDRRGIDLSIDTPRGRARPRVALPRELDDSAQLRAATVELTRRALIAAGTATA